MKKMTQFSVIVAFFAIPAMAVATTWTLPDDPEGRCWSQNCQLTGTPDKHPYPVPGDFCWTPKCLGTGDPDGKPKPTVDPVDPPIVVDPPIDHHDMSPLHNTPDVHNGFSCYYAPWKAWVFHAAARPIMTPEHVEAAKQEALDRRARLGDVVAMTKVCKPWQVRAGFEIAEVL